MPPEAQDKFRSDLGLIKEYVKTRVNLSQKKG